MKEINKPSQPQALTQAAQALSPGQRRGLIALLLGPLACGVLAWGCAWYTPGAARLGAGVVLGLALLVCGLNGWLRVRAWQQTRHGPPARRGASGLPLVSTLMALAAVVLGWGDTQITGLALLVLLLDPDGTTGMALLFWRYPQLLG